MTVRMVTVFVSVQFWLVAVTGTEVVVPGGRRCG